MSAASDFLKARYAEHLHYMPERMQDHLATFRVEKNGDFSFTLDYKEAIMDNAYTWAFDVVRWALRCGERDLIDRVIIRYNSVSNKSLDDQTFLFFERLKDFWYRYGED